MRSLLAALLLLAPVGASAHAIGQAYFTGENGQHCGLCHTEDFQQHLALPALWPALTIEATRGDFTPGQPTTLRFRVTGAGPYLTRALGLGVAPSGDDFRGDSPVSAPPQALRIGGLDEIIHFEPLRWPPAGTHEFFIEVRPLRTGPQGLYVALNDVNLDRRASSEDRVATYVACFEVPGPAEATAPATCDLTIDPGPPLPPDAALPDAAIPPDAEVADAGVTDAKVSGDALVAEPDLGAALDGRAPDAEQPAVDAALPFDVGPDADVRPTADATGGRGGLDAGPDAARPVTADGGVPALRGSGGCGTTGTAPVPLAMFLAILALRPRRRR